MGASLAVPLAIHPRLPFPPFIRHFGLTHEYVTSARFHHLLRAFIIENHFAHQYLPLQFAPSQCHFLVVVFILFMVTFYKSIVTQLKMILTLGYLENVTLSSGCLCAGSPLSRTTQPCVQDFSCDETVTTCVSPLGVSSFTFLIRD